MRKRKTLKERARAYAGACPGDPYGEPLVADAWLAGHRANRISAAERRVVEAAVKVSDSDRSRYSVQLVDALSELDAALKALQRAKGGRNG